MVVAKVEITERKIFSLISIAFFMYLLILSIELIKSGVIFLIKDLSGFILYISSSPAKSLGFGWLLSGLAQSGGATASLSIILLGAGAIGLVAAIYMIIGCFIGRTITEFIVSLVSKSKSKKEFRYGFEIAAVNNIYNIFLVVIAVLLEFGMGFFSKIGFEIGEGFKDMTFLSIIPDFSDKITGHYVGLSTQLPNQWITVVIGFVLLIVSLEFMTRSILHLMGGRNNARVFVKKYMGTTWKAFLIGVLITFAVTSTNVTITLLVPLAVARIITLREAVPYIIGANVGTVTEVLIAAVIIGTPLALSASLVYVLIPVIGALIFLPNAKNLHDFTKFLTKKLIVISKQKAIFILLILFLIPILLLFL